MVPSVRPLLALALPLGAALLIVLSGRRPAVREAWSVLAAAAQAATVLTLVPGVAGGQVLEAMLLDLAPGVPLVLRADALGTLFAALSSGLWTLTTVYSAGYVRAHHEHAQTRYFCCFAVALAAAVGVAFAGNLLTFVLFYELLTLATYPLVAHRETRAAVEAGRLYLAYTLTAGAALLAGTAWVHALAGTGEFRPGGVLPPGLPTPARWLLLGLLVLGVGVKAALLPLHAWLPVAMVAPTPVSALLHAVAVVKAGVFGVLRVGGYVVGGRELVALGASDALTALAAATILGGSLLALTEDHLKRRLAYSTVSQLAYVVLGLGLGTASALTGAIQHMVNHGVLKITLFFCAGAIAVTTGRERVSELGGLGRRMPLTFGVFTLAALALAGVPPGAAFLSKWYLIRGALEAGRWPAAAVLLASALLNLAYWAPIVIAAFFAPGRTAPTGPDGAATFRREAPLTLLGPLVLTGVGGLWLGLFPDAPVAFLSLAARAARELAGG